MKDVLLIISDIAIFLFDHLLYAKVVVPRKRSTLCYGAMYGGSLAILAFYIWGVHFSSLTPAAASLLCTTLPSLLLFFILSEHRDARFLFGFLFIDIVAFILSFFNRVAITLGGNTVALVSCVLLCTLLTVTYLVGLPYFHKYRELIGSVKDGWFSLTVAMVTIFVTLVLLTQMPKPIMERTEYFPSFIVLCIAVITCLAVFVCMLMQKRKLYLANEHMSKERVWHDLAYVDALTGLKNRMAYMEYISELERGFTEDRLAFAVMVDIDRFKRINDTLGHREGDKLLRRTAQTLATGFSEDNYSLFRIGGDEFAVVAIDVEEAALAARIESVQRGIEIRDPGFRLSFGYAQVFITRNNAFEEAFVRADREMYREKERKRIDEEYPTGISN